MSTVTQTLLSLPVGYAAIGASVWFAPAWFRRVLAALRDLDDYRDERARRRVAR